MSALASDKQKHKVVMYYYDTVLSLILTNTAPYLENWLDLIKIIGKDTCSFQGEISYCPSDKLDLSVMQAEICLAQ